jgi:hypothetical protein
MQNHSIRKSTLTTILSLFAAASFGVATPTTYKFSGTIDRVETSAEAAFEPYGIRVGKPFHGYFTFDLETLTPDGGFGLPFLEGESSMSVAGYEFVTSFGYLLGINNDQFDGGDFVQFWNPLPDPFLSKDLWVSADDVTFNFKDLTGAIVQSSDSIDGIDFDLFPDKSFQWFAVGWSDKTGESFSFLLNGAINKMKLHSPGSIDKTTLDVPHGGSTAVPDGGSTAALLTLALAAMGVGRRQLTSRP